jgi:O-antigen/teichoic acid export membrane protein
LLTARVLLPEGRGALAAVLLWPQTFAALGALAVPEALIYLVAAKPSHRRVIASTGLALAIGLGVSSGLLGLWFVPRLLGPGRGEWADAARWYAAVFIPLNVVTLAVLAVDQGKQRFLAFNLVRLIPSAVYLVGLVGLVGLGRLTVESALWANFAGTAVAAGVRLARRDAWGPVAAAWGWRIMRQALAFYATMLTVLLSTQVDRLFVVLFFSDRWVGLYAVGMTVAGTGLGVITNTFSTLALPMLAAAEGTDARRANLAKLLRGAFTVLVLGTIPVALLSPLVVPLAFGDAFKEAVPATVTLLAAYVPYGLKQIVARGLRGFGEARPGTISEALSLLAFAATCFPLGAALGLVGVALATFFGASLGLAYLAWWLHRRGQLPPREWLRFAPAEVLLAARTAWVRRD